MLTLPSSMHYSTLSVMLGLERPMRRKDRTLQPILQESSADAAIIISLCYAVDVAWNMILMSRWEFFIL